MDLALFGLPIPVALAAVAVLGYLIGRRGRPSSAAETNARREIKRARAIIRDLEAIAQHVRRDIAQHHSNLSLFKKRLDAMMFKTPDADWQALADEAERLLKPTQFLASQLAHAYEGIRKQATQLTTFTSSRTDSLTGLANRQALDDSLDNLLAMRSQFGSVFSLVVLDIDKFNQINGRLGRKAGDRVLQQVAALLDHQVRDSDVVARFGGEEFMVLLPGTDLLGAGIFADRIRAAVQKVAHITVSGGVTAVQQGDVAKTILSRADAALYSAKAAGGNAIFQHDGTEAQACSTSAGEMDELDLAEILA